MPTGTISADIDVAVARDDTELARATMRRVSVRILPLIFILYVCNFIDRTNVAMASLQMNVDLRLSGRAYAFGVGTFSSAMWCSRCRAMSYSRRWERGAGSRGDGVARRPLSQRVRNAESGDRPVVHAL